MRIVLVDIHNYRGIKSLCWSPSAGINCLIGPGDCTKTTILDAIELALNPKSYSIADDSDFYDLDVDKPIEITVTLTDLPPEFSSDDRYGLHLRGWNALQSKIEDEPGEGLEYALSIRLTVDKSLEARWTIFNDRVAGNENDPPTIRYKDSKQLVTMRLGPYAERHLGWGRQSILSRNSKDIDSITLQLAEANRAARQAFRAGNKDAFKETASRAEILAKQFAVPVRDRYSAELDVQGINVTTGGIALHDGNLPLRCLGTGSSRLIVSALQHDAGESSVALIDEIEHGLEPHRIARLLKYLKSPAIEEKKDRVSQIFMTTHSPVVICELKAAEIFAVRSVAGGTTVRSVAETAKDLDTAQRHLRQTPAAFLARKILVGEGRTEQGLMRGLDAWWSSRNVESYALQGTVAVDGEGIPKAPVIAEHLLKLGYKVFLLLDSDEEPDANLVDTVKQNGGAVFKWPDTCSTEERIFLDVPWETVISLIRFAEEVVGSDSVRDSINNARNSVSLPPLTDLTMPESFDDPVCRRAIGKAAKHKKNSWFKSISKGEKLAEIIAPCLEQIPETPLAKTLAELRKWVDA